MKLCKNGKIFNDGRHKYFLCKINNRVCVACRFCNDDDCFKMSDRYEKKCKFATK